MDDIDTQNLEDAHELTPVELPGRNLAPSIQERLDTVESILNIH